MARGRKSPGSLTLIARIPGQGRPPPPRGLDPLERRHWQAIVATMPPFWFDPAAQTILRRVVAQAVVAERLETRLRLLRQSGQDGSEEATALTGAHAAAAKVVAQLMTSLRATPRSRVLRHVAGPAIAEVPARKPWDIRADDSEAG
jgi:hypothetical protein